MLYSNFYYEIIPTYFIQLLFKHFILFMSLLMALLVIYAALFSSLGLDVGSWKHIGKWCEILVLNIIVLKWVFTNL